MVNLTDPPTPSAADITDLRLGALERQLAELAGRLQLADEQNLALQRRTAEMATKMDELAATLRTLDEANQRRRAARLREAHETDCASEAAPVATAQRRQVLAVLPGGAS